MDIEPAAAQSQSCEPLVRSDDDSSSAIPSPGTAGKHRGWSILNRTLKGIVSVDLICLALLVLTNVVARSFLGFSLLWEQEATQLGLTILTFVGAAIAYESNSLISMAAVRDHLESRYRLTGAATAFVEGFVTLTAVLLIIGGVKSTTEQWSLTTPLLKIEVGWFDVIFVAGIGLVALVALRRLASVRLKDLVRGLAVLAFLAGAEIVLRLSLADRVPGAAIWIALGSLIVFVAAAIPIPICFAATALLYVTDGHIGPVDSITQAATSELSSFILVAVPLFILAGLLMTGGGLSRRLLRAIELLLRRVRGGVGHAIVVAMYLFSGISGSKIADVAAVGSAVVDEAERLNLPRQQLAAVLSASAIMGETVPPSVALLVAATVANVSILAAFAAGILPAALIALILMIYIAAGKRESKGTQQTYEHVGRMKRLQLYAGGLPALVVAFILIGGLLSGISSPTEVSAVACLVALVFGVILMRDLSWKSVASVIRRTSEVSGMVLFLIVTANSFAYGLSLGGIPIDVANGLQSLHSAPWAFMLGTIVVLPLIGLILEGLPAILVMVPLLMPVTQILGINPVLYVVVMVLSLGAGTFLPPVGVGLCTAAMICDVPVSAVTAQLLKYLIPVALGILLIAFIPDISLFLPRLLGVGAP